MEFRRYVRQFWFGLAIAVSACGPAASPSGNAAPAAATAPAATATAAPQTIDPCALLTSDDVTALFGEPAPVPMVTSFTQLRISASATTTVPLTVTCDYRRPALAGGVSQAPRGVIFQICRCNATTAEFDTWSLAKRSAFPEAPGRLPGSAKFSPVSGVGEGAYLFPEGRGIEFRASGADLILNVYGPSLSQFVRPGATADPRDTSGRLPQLPTAELDAKATTVFSGLALKVLGRLPSAFVLLPLVTCTVGSPPKAIPTAIPPTGFIFEGCRANGPAMTFSWSGPGGSIQLTKYPLGTVGGAPGPEAVDINGSAGTFGPYGGGFLVSWSDATATYSVVANQAVGREAVLAFARSVR